MSEPASISDRALEVPVGDERLVELERELDSMSASGAALMEQNAMFGEFLGGLSFSLDEDRIARLAIEKLMVAAHVERAAYVRIAGTPDAGETVVELVLDEASAWPQDAPEGTASRSFRVGAGAIGRAVAGSGTAILQSADDAGSDVDPRSPERRARRELLAAPVRFGTDSGERTLGVVLVMDRAVSDVRKGQGFGNEEATLVENVALMLGSALGSRHAAASERELKLAREIQQQILPAPTVEVDGLDVAGRCETSGAVGGDYFDFLQMADGRTLAVVADVSGHNIASGMVMVGARSCLRLLASRETAPSAVLNGLSDATFDDLLRLEKFVTAAGAALAPGSDRVELVNAGHNPTMVFRAARGVVEHIAGSDPILGFLPGQSYGSVEIGLGPGDVLLLYTDGFTEAQDPRGELYGETRLADVLARHADRGAAEILDALYAAVDAFTGDSHRDDDVTAVIVKRTTGRADR